MSFDPPLFDRLAMYTPRRRVTSLVLACFVIFAVWYILDLQYSQIFEATSQESTASISGPGGSTLNYPIEKFIQLPTAKPVRIPLIQYAFGKEAPESKSLRLERRAAVKASFEHTWEGYKTHAWMKDELTPMGEGGFRTSFGGWAATLVDTLDTLWVMGMEQDFSTAVEAVSAINLNTTEQEELNVFETTIRYLGGFLGAYDISDGKYPVLLHKAVEVADLLYRAFDTPNHMPVTRWNWKAGMAGEKQEAGANTLIAELGSLSLEFTRLSQVTENPKYFDAIQRVTDVLADVQPQTKIPGLWPVLVNAAGLKFEDTGFTLGGMADSTYEYLPKQHMLLGGKTMQYKQMYERAIDAAKEYIFFRPLIPDNTTILFSGSAGYHVSTQKVQSKPQGQHLGCFVGGMVGIGSKIFDRPDELAIARQLVDGCIWAYDSMPTGIMPEVLSMVSCRDPPSCPWDEQEWHNGIPRVSWKDEEKSFANDQEHLEYTIKRQGLVPGITDIEDRRYILRPEAIESVFILYRMTGDPALLEAAWRMFQAIEKHTRTEIANAGIKDVTAKEPEKDNRMESFWLAETLKYFYLIFSEPDLMSLDDFVL